MDLLYVYVCLFSVQLGTLFSSFSEASILDLDECPIIELSTNQPLLTIQAQTVTSK